MSELDLDSLLIRLFDGDMSQSETRDLLNRLDMEPERRAELAELICLHRMLGAAGSFRSAADKVMLGLPASAARTTASAVLAEINVRGGSRGGKSQIAPRKKIKRARVETAARSGRGHYCIRRPRRDERRAMPLFAAAAGIAVTSAVALIIWLAGKPGSDHIRTAHSGHRQAPAVVERIHGDSYIVRKGQRLRPAPNMELFTDDRIELGDSASLSLRHVAATNIEVKASSVLRLDFVNGEHRVHLSKGGIEARTTARIGGDSPFVVSTPQAKATVLGTIFAMDVNRHASRLVVSQGKVRFERTSDGRQVEVEAGHFAIAAAGQELLSRPLPQLPPPLARYDLDEGHGTVANDNSGDGSPLDLVMSGEAVSWVNGGVRFKGGSGRMQSPGPASELHRRILASGSFSVEIWAKPEKLQQIGPARIVSYSGDHDFRNFTLGHGAAHGVTYTSDNGLDLRVRASSTSDNGLSLDSKTPSYAPNVLDTSLQHLVATYDGNMVRLYRNGVELAAAVVGSLRDWDARYPLVFGNEADGSRGWQGILYEVALYDQTLEPREIELSYKLGKMFQQP